MPEFNRAMATDKEKNNAFLVKTTLQNYFSLVPSGIKFSSAQ